MQSNKKEASPEQLKVLRKTCESSRNYQLVAELR